MKLPFVLTFFVFVSMVFMNSNSTDTSGNVAMPTENGTSVK